MAYTVADTDELVRTVEEDLATVVDRLRADDHGLRSIILTGGFARGEGMTLAGRPQNDYDFVAVRGLAPPRVSYKSLEEELSRTLGIHVDLAPVAGWRLPWVSSSIFWYETALRGRVLWGEDLLGRIPVRRPEDLDPFEGLRLLVNRAAGLLLTSQSEEAHTRRLQASKALLAVLDMHLLALGLFAPSQTERWEQWCDLRRTRRTPPALEGTADWLRWAYAYKTRPDDAEPREPGLAWTAAAHAVHDAVPTALRHAGLSNLDDYARRDGLLDHLIYWRRARSHPGLPRALRNPTGRVRLATLRLLGASLDGNLRPDGMGRVLGGMADGHDDPIQLLDTLRQATLQ